MQQQLQKVLQQAFNQLQRFIRGSDMGLVSLDDAHRFGVAEELAILLIFGELRGVSRSVE